MDKDELTALVHRIWFDDMAPKERTELKRQIAESLRLQHAHVVGVIDFNDDAESPAEVAEALLQLAGGGGGGACGL